MYEALAVHPVRTVLYLLIFLGQRVCPPVSSGKWDKGSVPLSHWPLSHPRISSNAFTTARICASVPIVMRRYSLILGLLKYRTHIFLSRSLAKSSAPDIAGQNKANPIATILSVAMMMRYSFQLAAEADAIEQAVDAVLAEGWRTPDIAGGGPAIGTMEMGRLICEKI